MSERPTPAPLPEGKGAEDSAAGRPASVSKRVEVAHTRSHSQGAPPGAPSPEGGGWGGLLSLHILALFVFLGLWTWKLLEPNPLPEAVSERLKGSVKFVAAKGLHACGYGFLTLLAVTLPLPNYWRWFLAALLALHGVATEIGQTFVPGRTGSIRDVLIDWLGVLLGVLVWQVLARRAARRKPTGKS